VYDFGDDPSIVTKRIGLEPTKSFVKGDSFPNHSKSRRQHSIWEIQSPLPLSVDVEEHIEALLSFLESNIEAVQKAKENFEVGVSCAVYYHEGCNQGFYLTESIIERLAKLNLSIDFDLYFLGDDVN
jgi:hypothetical protein